MAVQSSPPVSLSDVASEFGATTPYSLTDFYRGGTYVPDSPVNSGVPASGSISLTDLLGATDQLVYTITEGTFTISGVSGTFYGYRESPSAGSVSPSTLYGANIEMVAASSGDFGARGFRVRLTGNRAQGFFTSVEPQGGPLLETSNAFNYTYNAGDDYTEWQWAGLGSLPTGWDGSGSREAYFI